MNRYFLELAYKGTAYSGFQVQDNANTVQGELQKAMSVFFRKEFELTGSSRTDSGVHARQNYFHFDSDLIIPAGSVYNLNAILPGDITVKGIYEVSPEAHCRFDAVAREYRYCIYRQKDPFMADRGWLYSYPLDISLLLAAAEIIKEYTEFSSFSKRNTQVKTFQCEITVSEWLVEENKSLVYRVRGNRFLRGMVRGLVATMLKVGRGQIALSELREIFEAKDCTRADFSAPPQGLFLEAVEYGGALGEMLRRKAN